MHTAHSHASVTGATISLGLKRQRLQTEQFVNILEVGPLEYRAGAGVRGGDPNIMHALHAVIWLDHFKLASYGPDLAEWSI